MLECRSLGAVLLLASASAPSLPPDDALYLKTFETREVWCCTSFCEPHVVSGFSDFCGQGVKKLPSGVLYRPLKESRGKSARPAADSRCTCKCTGTLINGAIFFNGASNSADGSTCTLVPRDLVKVCAQPPCAALPRHHFMP